LQVPNLVKIIYAPHKAFKEIAANPTYLGPLLVAVLFVAANVGSVYLSSSKTYFEQTLPTGLNHDEWTENMTFWTSPANITESADAVTVSYPPNVRPYYGTKSIAFSMNTSSELWMELDNIGSVNCSSPDGYSKLSFRVKQISPQENPINVTVYLLSISLSNYFSCDLTQNFSSATLNIWNNLTLPLVSGWNKSSSDTEWDNITGFKLDFNWQNVSNITLLVDGLFFHGPFESYLENSGSSYALTLVFSYVMQFVITWVILGGVLYLLSKTLGAKLVWKVVLIVVGCILVTMVVQVVVNTAAWGTLSNIKIPFELSGGLPGEGQAAYNTISEQTWLVVLVGRISQIGMYVWTIALAALAVHLLGEFSWTRSFLAATVAYFATLFIGSFLFG
jgi:hypothetical protein